MSIMCGYYEAGICNIQNIECDGRGHNCDGYGCGVCGCERCNPRYSGKDYNESLIIALGMIREEFITGRKKSRIRCKSLIRSIAISGHCAEFEDDFHSIFYTAGIITLLQHHKFNYCSYSDKTEAYKLMKKLDLKLDSIMIRDYKNSMAGPENRHKEI